MIGMMPGHQEVIQNFRCPNNEIFGPGALWVAIYARYPIPKPD
jgi:hypothetical protein